MRVVLFLTVLTFTPGVLTAQSVPEWDRVYTFEDSTIEMNTSLVTSISKDVSRVRFRWTFNQPQTLGSVPETTYQSQLEVMEFDCSQNRYRPYHVTFFDSHGNIVRIHDSPGEWNNVTSGTMIEKLFVPGCNLIKKKTSVAPVPDEKAPLDNVALFAHEFAQHLQQEKDFKPLIDRFFVGNYLAGYLQHHDTSWFSNLNPHTAALLSSDELQRFYVAQMNAAYLTSLYLISQLPSELEDPATVKTLLPPDVLNLLRHHPYTAQYKIEDGNFEFLGENIDGVERLRTYTDLLERISSLMRGHVTRVRATESKEWQAMLAHWDLYRPKIRVCARSCFGLPAGAKLFEVNVPVFRLQVADVGGQLKVVSARTRF